MKKKMGVTLYLKKLLHIKILNILKKNSGNFVNAFTKLISLFYLLPKLTFSTLRISKNIQVIYWDYLPSLEE